jgi:small GTP-binding protein
MEQLHANNYECIRDALSALQAISRESGDNLVSSEAESALLALNEQRFNVAFIGQFKRGKSSLINAILGEEILPADMLPITSVITVVQFGEMKRCTVNFLDGQSEQIGIDVIPDYVSEVNNPSNVKGVKDVVVELPTHILQNGIRLVDTPGVGSIFALNTETTIAYIPKIDIVIIVLGSDPPVSAEELTLIRTASQRANSLYVVLNKADLVDPSAIERVKVFTLDAIKNELGVPPERVFIVSARDVLHGKVNDGLNELVGNLVELSNRSRSELSLSSARHAVVNLSQLLIQKIELETVALLAPISELDSRIERFAQSTQDISDLMLGVSTRIRQNMKYDWKTWDANRQKTAEKEKSRILLSIENDLQQTYSPKTKYRQLSTDLARAKTREVLEEWRQNTVEWVNANYTCQAGYVKNQTDRLVERVATAASEAFGIAIQPFHVGELQYQPAKLAFDLSIPVLALDLSDWLAFLVDLFLPRKSVIVIALRHAGSIIDEWLVRNMYSIDESVIDWISTSTNLLHNAMQDRIKAMQDEILSVLDEGRRRREAGGAAIKSRLDHLEHQKADLNALWHLFRLPGSSVT